MNEREKGGPMTDYMATAEEHEVYSCRIDNRGRRIRLIAGIFMAVITVLLGIGAVFSGSLVMGAIALGTLLLAGLMIGQAMAGKCVARAMGINTPF